MELFHRAPSSWQTRWASFENPAAAKGQAALSNHGAKGRAFEAMLPGETKTLLDTKGTGGTICRIWITVDDRSPERLRALELQMFWDGCETPAVSCPLGDFFAVAHGRTAAFESEFFVSPEGRSFLCLIPMPFHQGAKIRGYLR